VALIEGSACHRIGADTNAILAGIGLSAGISVVAGSAIITAIAGDSPRRWGRYQNRQADQEQGGCVADERSFHRRVFPGASPSNLFTD
jgi:hypothetical protein